MKKEDSPLEVVVKNGKLLISMGTNSLAFCALKENGGPLDEGEDIDKNYHIEWAKDVVYEMNREDEQGSTPLSRFIDEMFIEAKERGSAAVLAYEY